MKKSELKINEQSIQTELNFFKDKPYECLFEYIWNSFDAGATKIEIKYDLPKNGFGYIDTVEIIDDGKGWDFDKDLNTETFLSSTKSDNNSKNKTLPKGKFGRGRYTFIWIADKLEIYSKKKKLVLQHNTDIETLDDKENIKGTKVCFIGINEIFSTALSSKDTLLNEILLEFGWFLKENSVFEIIVNDKKIEPEQNIKEIKILSKKDFTDDIQGYLDDNFKVEIILWDKKPSEYSKFYFLNENKQEIFKKNTGLNKKGDNFWHSVYIISNFFSSDDKNIGEDETTNQQLDFGDKKFNKVKKQLIEEIKKELVKMRKPYLIKQSDFLLEELKENELIPDLPEFGIYDEESYDDLLKTIYTISPSLFTNKGNPERKFICATFAGLLSTQDDTLIKVILEQLQELTEDEKNDLLDILNRASLSNIIKTIKEIDHRLDVLEKLKILLMDYEKETLEVKHIQKILDQNFWIFGEQFRLFSSTEGALKKVLIKYAKEILKIGDPELETQPNGEVDLFLTKTESVGETTHRNIVVELKRTSTLLKEDKEYKQLNDYRKKTLEQSVCNGENQYWEFYLIGKNYDQGIKDLIESAKTNGEKEKGLTLSINDGRIKIYVRKWSDILEVEWNYKMKYLKEKLQIQAKKEHLNSPDDIVNNLEK